MINFKLKNQTQINQFILYKPLIIEISNRRRPAWKAKCSCGNEGIFTERYLLSHNNCGNCKSFQEYKIDKTNYRKYFGNEIWRNTVFDNYQISSWGRVRKLLCDQRFIYLKPIFDKYGYIKVGVTNSDFCTFKHRKYFYVHRLVAKAFLSQTDSKYNLINHKDEIKYHNFVSNLEWCNDTYNMNYGHKRQKTNITRDSHNKLQKVFAFKDGLLIQANSVSTLSKYLHCQQSSISQVINSNKLKGINGWSVAKKLNRLDYSYHTLNKYLINNKIICYGKNNAMKELKINSYRKFNKLVKNNNKVKKLNYINYPVEYKVIKYNFIGEVNV